MDKIEERIFTKRKLLGLPDVHKESDEFKSDVRHLCGCIFFIDQHTGRGGEERFVNLELLDPFEAKEYQVKFEAQNGLRHGGLGDIIDLERKRVIEITFTSGSMLASFERKRMKNRNSVILVFSELCDEVFCSDSEYRILAEESMNALKGMLFANGMLRQLNSAGSIKRDVAIDTPPIAGVWSRILEKKRAETERNPGEALQKIAKQNLMISTSGAFQTIPFNEDGEYEVWACPWLRDLKPVEMEDKPFGEMVKTFFDGVTGGKGNGHPMEETLVAWIVNRQYKIENSEFVLTDPISYKCFGERQKKPTVTWEEAQQKGVSFFEPDEKRSRRKAKGVSRETVEMYGKCMYDEEDEISLWLARANRLLQSQGTAMASLHRKSHVRMVRPVLDGGDMYGFIMKSTSKASDPMKEAHMYVVVLGKHPEGKDSYFQTENGDVPFYIETKGSKSTWDVPLITSELTLIWEKEFKYEMKKMERCINPFTLEMEECEFWRMVMWSKAKHVEELWKSSAVSEALGAMLRKIGFCVEAKTDGRVHGAVGGYLDMCNEIQELTQKAHTVCGFVIAGLCSVLTKELSREF